MPALLFQRPIHRRHRSIAHICCQLLIVNDKVHKDIQAVLRFPLPSDAHVGGYKLGGVEAIAVSKTKAAAVQYAEKEKGREVATASSVQGAVWQTDVYPLPFGVVKCVELTIFCKLSCGNTADRLKLHLPLTFSEPLPVTVSTALTSGSVANVVVDGFGGATQQTTLSEGLTIDVTLPEAKIAEVSVAEYDGLTYFSGHVNRICLEASFSGALSDGCSSDRLSCASPLASTTAARPADDGTMLIAVLVDCSRSAAPMAQQTLNLLNEIVSALKCVGRRPAFSVWSFSTTTQRLTSGSALVEAESALRGLRYDGGTDLSLLDGIVSTLANEATYEAVLLVSDGVDSLPGKRFPTLQLEQGAVCPPIYVPLPPESHNANLSMLRWLCYQTGGRALPISTGSQMSEFSAVFVGAAPQFLLTKISTDLDADVDAFDDDAFVT